MRSARAIQNRVDLREVIAIVPGVEPDEERRRFASALLVGGISRRRSISADAAIGVVTTASFAVGLALISRYHSFTRNFDAALFGNVLGVTGTDVIVLACVAAGAVALVFLFYRRLLFVTFDPEVADVFGVRSARVEALLALLLRNGRMVGKVTIGRRGGGLKRIERLLEDHFFDVESRPHEAPGVAVDVEIVGRWLATHRDHVVAFDPTDLRSAREVAERLRWYLEAGGLRDPQGDPLLPR